MAMQDLHIIVQKIVHLAKQFHLDGNKSPIDLLDESGYVHQAHLITAEQIEKEFRENPDCADHWIRYSEDARGYPAWYIADNGKDFTVGYCDPYAAEKEALPAPESFTDNSKACASYVHNTVQRWRRTYWE